MQTVQINLACIIPGILARNESDLKVCFSILWFLREYLMGHKEKGGNDNVRKTS